MKDWELTEVRSCKKARLFNQTETESKADKTNQQITNLAVPVIRKWIDGVFISKAAARDYFHEKLSEFEDKIRCTKTLELREEAEWRCIERFMDCNTEPLVVAEPQSFQIFGLDAEISPTFFVEYADKIKVIKMKNSKPSVSSRGQKPDTKLSVNKQLYTYLRYGANLIKPGETKEIEACFYYLKQKTDKDDWDENFFPYVITTKTKTGKDRAKTINHGNVVSITETYTKTKFNQIVDTETDLSFEPLFEKWKLGADIECNPTDCKFCSSFGLCSYAKAVKPTVETKAKRVRAFLPSLEQEAVINKKSGITELIAGAGSGKSTVLIQNVLELLNSCKPQSILNLMYNKDAQKEFKEKLIAASRGRFKNIDKVNVHTFDGFCYNIIKEEAHYKALGFSNVPELIESNDKASIIENLIREQIVDGIDYTILNSDMPTTPGAVQTVMKAFDIIKRKDFVYGDEELLKAEMDGLGKSCIVNDIAYKNLFDVYALFDDLLKDRNLIDYPDMPNLLDALLDMDPYMLNKYGYKHIRVDEFQDVDEKEFNIILKLMDTPAFQSLIVVGDDAQSIYSFKGANPEFIIKLEEKMHTPIDVIFMTENYRCQKRHVELANKFIASNTSRIDKECTATRPDGKEPIVTVFLHQDAEYDSIVKSIQSQIEDGIKEENIAILLADNTSILKMQDKLVKAGISVNVKARASIQNNSRVLAAQGLRKAFDNAFDTAAIQTYLNGIYDGELFAKFNAAEIIEKIEDLQFKIHKYRKYPDDKRGYAFMRELRKLNMDDELYTDFISKLYPYAEKGYKALSEHMYAMELYGSKDTYKKEKSYKGVVLTTLHSSKGLEWDNVYVSLTKVHAKEMKREDIEEKRRLIYVAFTRAKNELYISSVLTVKGDKTNRTYNQFLEETCRALSKPYDPIEIEKYLNEQEKIEKRKGEGQVL